jgi:hypothetical protein
VPEEQRKDAAWNPNCHKSLSLAETSVRVHGALGQLRPPQSQTNHEGGSIMKTYFCKTLVLAMAVAIAAAPAYPFPVIQSGAGVAKITVVTERPTPRAPIPLRG